MNRQEVSWLIIRGLGLYLLLEAFMLVPDLLAGIYASRIYSNMLSSLSSESEHLASTVRQATDMYRSFLFAPLIKIVLFSVVGLYLLKGGGFLFRLLNRHPDTEGLSGGEGEA
jgi:hypothetical protein